MAGNGKVTTNGIYHSMVSATSCRKQTNFLFAIRAINSKAHYIDGLPRNEQTTLIRYSTVNARHWWRVYRDGNGLLRKTIRGLRRSSWSKPIYKLTLRCRLRVRWVNGAGINANAIRTVDYHKIEWISWIQLRLGIGHIRRRYISTDWVLCFYGYAMVINQK